MKRSRKVALMMMAPASVLFLSSCGEPKTDALVYSSVSECLNSGLSTQQVCEEQFKNAQAMHAQVAPKYLSKAECEADFGEGKCENPAPNSQASQGMGGVFMPMMMGYMMGRMMNGGAANAAQNPVATQPLYRSRDDVRFRTGANVPIDGASSGAVKVKPSEMRPQSGNLVRRGGFGTQAQRMGSLGG